MNGVTLTPQTLAFPAHIAPPGSAAGDPIYSGVTVANTGNRSLKIGTITGTNVSSTGDFAFASYNYCNNLTVSAGQSCSITVGFTPQALGNKTASISVPITYADNTTTTVTADLSGTGVAANPSVALTPSLLAFPNTVTGQTQANYGSGLTLNVRNTGNEFVNVGAFTGSNLTTQPGQGGDFYLQGYCSGVAPGTSCTFYVYFVPLTAGSRTGSLNLPIKYADGSTTTLTASLTGTGVAPAPALELSATQLNFRPRVAGTQDASDAQTVTLVSTGNSQAVVKTVVASANFTASSGCSYFPSTCTITVAFSPAASTAPGNTTGTLTIVDNTPQSPHIVQLAGQTLSPSQALVLSQTSLDLGSQVQGSTGQPQAVYLNNRGETAAVVNKLQLGGTNAADFTMTQYCGGTLGFAVPALSSCTIYAAFTPGATSSGTRTATIVVTPAVGPALQIQLTGNATTATPTAIKTRGRSGPRRRPGSDF